MKNLDELMDWVESKVKELDFFTEKGRIFDTLKIMAIELGKQDQFSIYPTENDPEIRFYSLADFYKQDLIKGGIGINADFEFRDFSYSKQYFYYALKIVKDPEIGIPNMPYPLIIRNNICSAFIAPKVNEDFIADSNEELPSIDEKLPLMKEELGAIITDPYGYTKFWLHISSDFHVPYILDYEDEEKRVRLIKPNEVVIDEEELTMVIDYPLSAKVRIKLKKKGGFTRLFIFKSIYEAYKQIYKEEDEESGDPGTYNNLYNRKRAGGKYGIWGHYLEDLVIESVIYNPKKNELYMFIGS
ncbi:MAG: hypothetical protein ACFFCC_18240 [Promethearchaeota archaeon]